MILLGEGIKIQKIAFGVVLLSVWSKRVICLKLLLKIRGLANRVIILILPGELTEQQK